jgi:Tol biopolymer transport system component
MNAGIYLAASDGTQADQLTQNSADGYPKWSPDGRSIAFLRVGERPSIDLYVMNADGSEVRPVAKHAWTNPYARFNYTWLPDGKHLLYDNRLIDLETGDSSELHFQFDASSAVWFMKAQTDAVTPTPLPPCNA